MEEKKELTGYPSIDKPWLKYYSEEAINAELPECTIYQNIYKKNKDNFDDIAIIYYGRKIRYRELFRKTEQVAKGLSAIGIKKGEVVNLCTAGVPEAIYLLLACNRIGAMANFINPLFDADQMRARINDTESEWLFVLDEMYTYVKDTLPGSCVKHVVILPVYESFPLGLKQVASLNGKVHAIIKEGTQNEQISFLQWGKLLKYGETANDISDVIYEKDVPAIMVYSSGSTGASKGIVLTNDGVLATNYCRNIPPDPVERQKTFLQMIPIWFSTGVVISIIIPLINGCIVILEPQFSKERFYNDIKRYKPNMALTANSLWQYVATSDDKKLDLSNLECPITGGEKVLWQDEDILNQFLKCHGAPNPIFKGYGMCELGGTVTSTSLLDAYENKKGGAGYPIRNVYVSAFDIQTNEELPYNAHGEIRVSSPARMKEYYKNPEATKEFFYTDEKGVVWGCTGDIGYVDEDGEVFVLGRKTDSALLENGKQVYLFDIENVILEEPSLSGCKVVAVEENGTIILAVHVTVRESISDERALIQKLNHICHSHLPEDECPSKYKLRKSFPVHPNGKRDVEALRMETEGFITV